MAAKMDFGLSKWIGEKEFGDIAKLWRGTPGLYEAIERMGAGAKPEHQDIGWLCEAFGWERASEAALRLGVDEILKAAMFAAKGPGGADAACLLAKMGSVPKGWAELCVAEILEGDCEEEAKIKRVALLVEKMGADLSARVARAGRLPLAPLERCRPDREEGRKPWETKPMWRAYEELARMGAADPDPLLAMRAFAYAGRFEKKAWSASLARVLPMWRACMDPECRESSKMAWSLAVWCGDAKSLLDLPEAEGVDWWAAEPLSLFARVACNAGCRWMGEAADALGERALAAGRPGARALHQALGALDWASRFDKKSDAKPARARMVVLCERSRAMWGGDARAAGVAEILSERAALSKAGRPSKRSFVEEVAKLAYESDGIEPVCEAVGLAYAAGDGALAREALVACAAAVERSELNEMLDQAVAAEEQAVEKPRAARRI